MCKYLWAVRFKNSIGEESIGRLQSSYQIFRNRSVVSCACHESVRKLRPNRQQLRDSGSWTSIWNWICGISQFPNCALDFGRRDAWSLSVKIWQDSLQRIISSRGLFRNTLWIFRSVKRGKPSNLQWNQGNSAGLCKIPPYLCKNYVRGGTDSTTQLSEVRNQLRGCAPPSDQKNT